MAKIHPTCVVHPQARIAGDVQMGPFCVIESGVELGSGCRLESHVVIKTGTTLGSDNYLADRVVLGGLPQHKRPSTRPGRVVIGNHNLIREHVTVHRALQETDETRLGDNNLLMVNAHVAHDCQVGDDAILANNVMLAGHVTVADRAYLSGGVAVHQYCRVGTCAMVGGQAHIVQDVPPFVTVDGLTSQVVGLNVVGLKRAGLNIDDLRQLKAAYRLVFRSGLRWANVLEQLSREYPVGPVSELYRFMSTTERGCVRERSLPRRATLRIHSPSSTNREPQAKASKASARAE